MDGASSAAVLGGAGITAGAGLLGGLFSGLAEARKRKELLEFQAIQQGAQMKQGAQAAMTGSQQQAFQDLMGSYRSALGGR